jgi:cell filamentation protein
MKRKVKPQSGKYLAAALEEFVPGSKGRVLKNLLGITSVRAMQQAELVAYLDVERKMIETFRKGQQLSVKDIHRLHRAFLGGIYAWAGVVRSVNISKGGFTFATSYALPQALRRFERQVLKPNTPCRRGPLEAVGAKIAKVHAEFLLLHPYREGNGRTARLVATLMAYQAGLPGMDFGFVRSRGREFDLYAAAVQAAMSGKLEPMEGIVLRALRRALRRSKRTSSDA